MNQVPVIHVVDDDASVRTALTRLLTANGYETRAYGSAGEFLVADRTDNLGCVLLDINMPGASGIELHKALVQQETALPVIFMTGYGTISMSVSAIKAGAVDFLTKPVHQECLINAIENAIELARKTSTTIEKKHELYSRYEKLTLRERQVFELVTEGMLNKQIAFELGTSERTIKAHRAKVVDKMNVRSVAQLVRAADQLKGWLRAAEEKHVVPAERRASGIAARA